MVQRLSQPLPPVQGICTGCTTEEEKLQKKEDSIPEPTGSAPEKKSLPKTDTSTSTLTSLIQAKCVDCEEEELQKKEAEEPAIQQKSFATDEETPEETIHRKYAAYAQEERLQKKPPSPPSTSLENRLNASKGGGYPLSEHVQSEMGAAFGADFSQVRIHTSTPAVQMNQELHAQAFTHGNDIFFNEDKYHPNSSSGKHLLAHELTHVVQQNGQQVAGNTTEPANTNLLNQEQTSEHGHGFMPQYLSIDRKAIQCALPDDEKVLPPIKQSKANELNVWYWETFKMEELKPLRAINPKDTPNAYANRTLEAQKVIKHSKAKLKLYEKKIWVDGILGPETWVFLWNIATREELTEERFQIAGLGFDLEALASVESLFKAQKSMVMLFKPEFLTEWKIQASGEPVIDHLTINDKEGDKLWYDAIIFGGPPPPQLVKGGFDLGDRHAILKLAYKDVSLQGKAALVKVNRGFLHRLEDNQMLVERDKSKPENPLWIGYKAENKSEAEELEGWFGLTYPHDKARKIREKIGTKGSGKSQVTLTGLLVSFYIPELTDQERNRLSLISMQYFQEKSESIEAFIEPKAEEIINLIEDVNERKYLLAKKISLSLVAFEGRPDLFEKFADFLINHPNQRNYFKPLLKRTESLGSADALERLVKLCLATRLKDDPDVVHALEVLRQLKRSIRSHDYVTGPKDQQGVRIEKESGSDDFLKVGEVTSGIYRITETRQQLKEARRKALEDKMRELIEQYVADALKTEGATKQQDLTEDQLMEKILEKAAQEVKITEDDFHDVEYAEGFRLRGVESKLIQGVEEFFVDYEKVFRIDEGEWQVAEPSRGMVRQTAFEEDLGWFKFHNLMKGVETIAGAVAIVVGGVVLLTTGAGSALIALGGGTKMVALSVGISVLIWAITADHLTIEGFLKAVLEGYLMAVGLRLFAPVGAGAARWIGTATFKQKLIGLALQSVVTGGASGAFTGVAAMFVEDILRGKLRSPGAYLKAAATGFLLGAMFELGGSLIIGPVFRVAGRNVLERISNIEQLKQFLKDAGVKLNPAQWGPEVAKSLAGFIRWLGDNLDGKLAAEIAKNAKEKAAALLRSLGEGFELTVHRQALDLIELGMTREAVEGLEKLIKASSRNLKKAVARSTVDDILNQLVKQPKRTNLFFKLLSEADDDLIKSLFTKNRIQDLASSDAILSLSATRPAAQINNLLDLRFKGEVNDFEAWARGLLAQSDDAQKKILDLLESRGSSVTHESLIRIAEIGVVMSDEVIEGLTRMARKAHSTGTDLKVFDDFIRQVPSDKMESFLQMMGHLPEGHFDDMLKMVKDPAQAGRLLRYVDDPDQLLRLLQSTGNKLDELDRLFQATKGKPAVPKEVESLVNRYGGNPDKVRRMVEQVDGDAALLERTITKIGSEAEVEKILNKAASHPSTSTDPAALRALLEIAEKEGQHQTNAIIKFIDQVKISQSGALPTTFATANDRLRLLVKHHPKTMLPFSQGSNTTLARADSFEDIILSNGSKTTIRITEYDLYHYGKGHLAEKFSFASNNLPPGPRKKTTFWPAGTTEDFVLSHARQALKDPKVATLLETGTGQFRKTTVDIGGFKYQVGIDTNTNRLTQFFPLGTQGGAIPTSGDILKGIKAFFNL